MVILMKDFQSRQDKLSEQSIDAIMRQRNSLDAS